MKTDDCRARPRRATVKGALFLIGCSCSWNAFSQQLDAALECTATKTDFVYECVVRLAKGGRPMSGARVTLGADMPSMPMAHGVKPVRAKPGKAPGEYLARLDLEMPGEWAVELRLGGRAKGRLVLLYEFDERGARPVTRGRTPPRK